jgi:hypothetical protein
MIMTSFDLWPDDTADKVQVRSFLCDQHIMWFCNHCSVALIGHLHHRHLCDDCHYYDHLANSDYDYDDKDIW